MENGIQTKDQERTILKALEGMPEAEAKILLRRIATHSSSSQKRSLWKTLFSFPYSRETMDSLMAFVGVLMSLLAFIFVLTLCIEHFYHLFSKK